MTSLKRNETAVPAKMVKTSIVGYCYGCQTFHYKGEQYEEAGATWCKHTGRLVDTSNFHPPIPVEIPQEWLDEALEGTALERDPQEKFVPPTPAEQIEEFMDSLALMFDIDTEKHGKHWEYLVSQVVALAGSKQPREVKKISKANKAAQGTQLTLISQDDAEESEGDQ